MTGPVTTEVRCPGSHCYPDRREVVRGIHRGICPRCDGSVLVRWDGRTMEHAKSRTIRL